MRLSIKQVIRPCKALRSQQPTTVALDQRLQAVAQSIRCHTHADIGSDHGQLLAWLFKSQRIAHGIAIENKLRPFENSQRALARFARDAKVDVRLGDGFETLEVAEADSVSICGMGANKIVGILESHPERLPARIIVQPNRQPEQLRHWATTRRFQLHDEQIVFGHWAYHVMTFVRVGNDSTRKPESQRLFCDQAYAGIDRQAGLLFGPLNLQRGCSDLQQHLAAELDYFRDYTRLHPSQERRLKAIRWALEYLTRNQRH